MSASASPSPSKAIDGAASDIEAIKQKNDLTIKEAKAPTLIIIKQADSLIMIDVENSISGGATLADEIIAKAQVDNLIIREIEPTDLRIVD